MRLAAAWMDELIHPRLRLIAVNCRLSVSGRWLSRHSAQWVMPSTDGKRFDFEFLRAISACWFLKYMLQSCDFASHITPSGSPMKWHQAHTTWFFEAFVLGAVSGRGEKDSGERENDSGVKANSDPELKVNSDSDGKANGGCGYAERAPADSKLQPRSPDPSASSTPHGPPTLWRRRRLLVAWAGGSCLSALPLGRPPAPWLPISKRSGASSRDAAQCWLCSLPPNIPE
jgi:hypothetical protein